MKNSNQYKYTRIIDIEKLKKLNRNKQKFNFITKEIHYSKMNYLILMIGITAIIGLCECGSYGTPAKQSYGKRQEESYVKPAYGH